MVSQILRRTALVLVAVCSMLIASCGERGRQLPETGASLEGTVTYEKKKVLVAMIIAQGENGSATGYVDKDGRYKLENVPLGEVQLAVNTKAAEGARMSEIMAQSQGKLKGPLPKVIDIPAKYADPKQSGIKTTVNKGPNTYDIVIPK